jgi:hypothetical protein
MAISGKYGKIEIRGVGDDEPVFVLRAQDRLAPHAIEMYGALAESHGSPAAKGVAAEAEAFRKWAGNKKLPD